MNPERSADPGDDVLSITEVERQTGIRQSTLRMWERRYGFPQPLRDAHGKRVYAADQVRRLHEVRRLLDQGFRPGRIFAGACPASWPSPACAAPVPNAPSPFHPLLAQLRAYALPELHRGFQHRLLDMGLRRFVIDFLAPLSTEVGLAWTRGELPVRSVQLYAQMAMSMLHAKQAALRASPEGRPRVLLATLSGEAHVLGVMMAEAVMRSLEMECIQLGAENPPQEVLAAARETGADIVALSFSAAFPCKSATRAVTTLRGALPPAVALWIGGEGVRGAGRLSGIEVFDTLDAIAPALTRWRAAAVAAGLHC